MRNQRYYSLPQAKDILGVSYDRVWYACVTGRVTPEVVGRTRLLTEDDIRVLRDLFEGRVQWKK